MALLLLWTLPVWAATKILFLGDSLSAGLGVEKHQAFPALVETELKAQGFDVSVVNGGISGSTSASALSRLEWFLRAQPDLVFLALGANDGLRGLSVEEMKANLSGTIKRAQAAGVKVVLAGIRMPPNYGKEYTQSFHQAFYDLAKKHNLPHLPKLLKGVAGRPRLNQADGIHPNEAGHQIIAKQVASFLAQQLAPQP